MLGLEHGREPSTMPPRVVTGQGQSREGTLVKKKALLAAFVVALALLATRASAQQDRYWENPAGGIY